MAVKKYKLPPNPVVKEAAYTPPKYLYVVTDGSYLEFVRNNTPKFVYKYIIATEKEGMEVEYDKAYIIRMLSYSFKEVQENEIPKRRRSNSRA